MPYSDEILAVAERVNNWGRWGDDDQRGTVNFVTDDVVVAAMASVRSGKRFSLAFPLQNAGLQTGAMPGRINPLRTMVALNNPVIGDPTLFCTSDDVVTMGLQAATHWDGLCHAGYDDRLYGGRTLREHRRQRRRRVRDRGHRPADLAWGAPRHRGAARRRRAPRRSRDRP